jgi:GT2 family glycosyltransferase
MWFKSAHNKSKGISTRKETPADTSDKTVVTNDTEVNELNDTIESPIQYWIDICGFVENEQLLIRGWAIDQESSVSISLLGEDKIPVYLQSSVREDREDVLSHLNLKSRDLTPGFFQLYDCELLTGQFYLQLKSDKNELTLPLDVTEVNEEKLANTYNEFLSLQPNSNLGNLSDDFNEIDETDEIQMHEVEMDDVEMDDVEMSLTAAHQDKVEEEPSDIVHYIERVGTFKNKFVIIKGWCADTVKDSEIVFSVKLLDSPLRVLTCIKRERLDVAQSLKLTGTKEKHGFLLIVELNTPTNSNLQLKFESLQSEKVTDLDVANVFDHKELENKLLDTNNFSLIEARRWLIENLGASYFSEVKKEFVDINEVTTNIQVESAITCGQNGTFFRGWIDNHFNTLSAICVSNGTKISENLLPLLCLKVRPDVNDAFEHLPNNYKGGFYCYSAIKKESSELAILLFEKSGAIVRIPLSVMTVSDNEVMATQHVLVDVEPTNNNVVACYQEHIMPALKGIWADRVAPPEPSEIKTYEFGSLNTDPECTIIVPLYGRYDFVLHQISQFEKDSTFNNVELIYVLDDPRIEHELLLLCEDVSKLYSTPFKVITCGRNLGFSGANNFGVTQAKGKRLLLLNSDVIPSESGWLQRMLTKYSTTNNIGAMGVKLVYEDETIQHIGMQFNQSREFGGIWLNEHQYKGMPTNLAPKFEFNKSDTVTAACLLIDKEKFEQVGGFETRYILGDFEDSDLCLKLVEQGYENYVLGSEKLYHLERQSQSLVDQGDWKFKLTLFNGWQHTARWNNMINELREKNV